MSGFHSVSLLIIFLLTMHTEKVIADVTFSYAAIFNGPSCTGSIVSQEPVNLDGECRVEGPEVTEIQPYPKDTCSQTSSIMAHCATDQYVIVEKTYQLINCGGSAQSSSSFLSPTICLKDNGQLCDGSYTTSYQVPLDTCTGGNRIYTLVGVNPFLVTLKPTTSQPSVSPITSRPSGSPSRTPSFSPITSKPSTSPITSKPSNSPSASPTTSRPSSSPSFSPSKSPNDSETTAPSETNSTLTSSAMSQSLSLAGISMLIIIPLVVNAHV